jgi:hypothetical protein
MRLVNLLLVVALSALLAASTASAGQGQSETLLLDLKFAKLASPDSPSSKAKGTFTAAGPVADSGSVTWNETYNDTFTVSHVTGKFTGARGTMVVRVISKIAVVTFTDQGGPRYVVAYETGRVTGATGAYAPLKGHPTSGGAMANLPANSANVSVFVG